MTLITPRQLADILATVFSDFGIIDVHCLRAVADSFPGDGVEPMTGQSEMYEALRQAAAKINEMAG